jgi:hypothetical protein
VQAELYIMKALAILIFLVSLRTFADSAVIIDVRKSIPLSDEEKPYKDFYLSNPSGLSMKKNQILTVVRKQNIRDSSGSQSYGELEIPVGEIKILMVTDKIAVAREHKLFSRDDLPLLEQIGIMTGDFVSDR